MVIKEDFILLNCLIPEYIVFEVLLTFKLKSKTIQLIYLLLLLLSELAKKQAMKSSFSYFITSQVIRALESISSRLCL